MKIIISKSSVLIVEDEPLIRLVLADFLRDCGRPVLEAGDAQEAIALLGQDKARVGVIFSDINMPGDLDGVGLARWVRSQLSHVKVILTSGRSPPADIGDVLMDDGPLIGKPYSLNEVEKRIHHLLDMDD